MLFKKNQAPSDGGNKMGTMPVGRLLISMAAPMMASMLFQALYNIVDSIYVSRINQDALNAVSLSFPLQSLMIGFGVGTGVGMNALLSRSLGAHDQDGADQAAGTGLFLYFLTAIGFLLVGLFATRPFFLFQTKTQAIVDYGTDYLTICLGCSFALFAQMAGERLLQSTGRTDLAMIPQLVGAIFNIIMDPVWIFGRWGFPELGVKGAAVATVGGQVLASVIGLVLNLKYNPEIHLSFKRIKLVPKIAAEIYRIGLPSLLMQCAGSIMTFFMNKILIGFTEAATAVFGAYFKIQSFVFMPCFGLNNAMVPIVSYNLGAKKYDRMKQATRLTVIIAIGIMVVGCILFETIPHVFLGFFNPTPEMLEVGIPAFRIIATHFPMAGFCIIAVSACQAMGKPIYSLITSVCRAIVILLPAAYLLSLTGRLELIWLAFPIAEFVSLVMNIFFLSRTNKEVLGKA